MLKMLIVALVGVAISTCGYLALHGVSFPSGSDFSANGGPAKERTDSLPAAEPSQSRPIRVSLTDSPARSLSLRIDGPFAVRAVGSEKVLHREKSLDPSRVEFAGQTLKFGKKALPGTRFEIMPESSPAIWVNNHQYRGTLRIYRQPQGELYAVNVLPLEDYIASVVDGEMPAAFPEDARKAQAICSRTYARYQMARNRSHPYFDVFASTRSQNYPGYQYLAEGRRLAGETKHGRKIARETAGLVCLHDGELFCTYYSAVCGGRTTRGDLVFTDAAPPLESVACNFCRDASYYRWSEKHSTQSAAIKLSSLSGSSRTPIASIRRKDKRPLTPASLFQISNGKRQFDISAVELRRRFSLPSSTFTVRRDAGYLLFQGQGHGHGVGLCQWGARGLAIEGKTAEDILKHYYPGCRVALLP